MDLFMLVTVPIIAYKSFRINVIFNICIVDRLCLNVLLTATA